MIETHMEEEKKERRERLWGTTGFNWDPTVGTAAAAAVKRV